MRNLPEFSCRSPQYYSPRENVQSLPAMVAAARQALQCNVSRGLKPQKHNYIYDEKNIMRYKRILWDIAYM